MLSPRCQHCDAIFHAEWQWEEHQRHCSGRLRMLSVDQSLPTFSSLTATLPHRSTEARYNMLPPVITQYRDDNWSSSSDVPSPITASGESDESTWTPTSSRHSSVSVAAAVPAQIVRPTKRASSRACPQDGQKVKQKKVKEKLNRKVQSVALQNHEDLHGSFIGWTPITAQSNSNGTSSGLQSKKEEVLAVDTAILARLYKESIQHHLLA